MSTTGTSSTMSVAVSFQHKPLQEFSAVPFPAVDHLPIEKILPETNVIRFAKLNEMDKNYFQTALIALEFK